MFILLKVAAAICIFSAVSASAAHEHSAHIHGHAELTIVIDKGYVDLNLIAPAESLLGFEYKVTTPEEALKVSAMKKHLSEHKNVIHFDSGECQIKHVNINSSDMLNDDHHEHPHAEISINYQFHCPKANEISSATLKLFKHYNKLKKIYAMWLTSSQQGSIVLDDKNTKINFQ